ncbi:ribose import ATP-binding protein RbsA [Lachnospiraceae bacterium]|nr:ribose import ATP-binding protein RbsA [Lachnospiraceae bacterium]
MEERQVVLRAEEICKTFDITKAVDHVSLQLNKGEIRGLIGENGSGKSTFVSMLCGILKIDSGAFILDGAPYAPLNQVDANYHGVSIVVQESGTLSGLTVAENIFLGKEDKYVKFGIKNVGKMKEDANRILKSYGYDFIDASAMIDTYDFETRKLVELVKATCFDLKIFVVDETTTALSQSGREELYKQMKRIRDEGGTVVFISHDLQEVLDKTDTISVFRDGQYIDTVNSADMTEDDLKRLMVGRELDEKYFRTDYTASSMDEVALSVEHVSVPGLLEDVSLTLKKGEILGIGGLSESGMHELGKALFGASYNRSGTVKTGEGISIDSIYTAINSGIAYASKNRDTESCILNQSIRDNICLPSLSELSGKVLISDKVQNQFAQEYAELMSVKMQGTDQFVSNLSGGNKQKVVLARWIGKDSDILILDSPTRGIDIKVKADIYALMEKIKAKGKAILMISEEIMELIGMSDRIIVMKDGRFSGEFERSELLSEEDIIKAMV